MAEVVTAERVDIFNDEGEKVGTVPRHNANGYVTWIGQVYIVNGKNELIITQRGPRQRFPEFWEFGITETIRSGESGLEAVIRGLGEELGIGMSELPTLAECFILPYRNPKNKADKKDVLVYGCMYDGPIRIDGIEIVNKEYLTLAQIRDVTATGRFRFTPLNLESWEIFRRMYVNGASNRT